MVSNGVNLPTDTLAIEHGITKRMCIQLRERLLKILMCIGRFLENAWTIATSDPRKVIHGVKAGIALTLVSVFYYMKPLYDGVGGNATWAVMTVVMVFEYSVGATVSKSFNRMIATFLGGSAGVGVHWIANQCGEELEPVILQASVTILAAAAAFSRFIPSVKSRFDYGVMIFILTFSFVSVSGYRVDKLLELAKDRASTIAIGTSICIFTGMFIYPVWAGRELHNLTYKNLERLADSLDGCVTEYFKENEENNVRKHEGYKFVLNSKATEEFMASMARWEPAHGSFKFRHPWKQYLKVGASMRSCAYCVETLGGFINSEVQAPELLKKHMREACMMLSTSSSNVLRELAMTTKTMTRSTKTQFFVQDMQFAVQSFQDVFKHLSKQALLLTEHEAVKENTTQKTKTVPIMAIFPITTIATLLIEITERVKSIVVEVENMATQADFKENKA
ncbi:hypothetical protein R6Q57_027813 [Mikania cordata]